MAQRYIGYFGWLVGLTLIQVLILSNIHVGGYMTPFLYIYLIVKLDSGMSRHEQMLWGFALGIIVDIFLNTPGMNAAATVLLAFVKPYLLHAFLSRDVMGSIVPSWGTMGFSSFSKYIVATTLVHHTLLIMLEYFSFCGMGMLMLRILICTAATTACILAVEAIRK